jgi:septum formation topological specificity factor MinE
MMMMMIHRYVEIESEETEQALCSTWNTQLLHHAYATPRLQLLVQNRRTFRDVF